MGEPEEQKPTCKLKTEIPLRPHGSSVSANYTTTTDSKSTGRGSVDIRVVGLKWLEFQSKKHGVEVDFSCDGMTAPNVLADYAHLKQVMPNLISNAIKYNR